MKVGHAVKHAPRSAASRREQHARTAGPAGGGLPVGLGAIWIGTAEAGEVPAIKRLLSEAQLPSAGVTRHRRHFIVARRQGELIGAVGAEVHGGDALLRSLVVAPGHRGVGVGESLLDTLDTAAAAWGVTQWWLLTTTAEGFFAQRGFWPASLPDVPAVIAATTQFRGLCPSAAVCLTRERRRL